MSYTSPNLGSVLLDNLSLKASDKVNIAESDYYQALKEDIRFNGVKQPILVEQTSRGYKILDGKHRVLAGKELDLVYIPAEVTTDKKQYLISLENRIKALENKLGMLEGDSDAHR